jgi:hypothetical protein
LTDASTGGGAAIKAGLTGGGVPIGAGKLTRRLKVIWVRGARLTVTACGECPTERATGGGGGGSRGGGGASVWRAVSDCDRGPGQRARERSERQRLAHSSRRLSRRTAMAVDAGVCARLGELASMRDRPDDGRPWQRVVKVGGGDQAALDDVAPQRPGRCGRVAAAGEALEEAARPSAGFEDCSRDQ